MRVSGRMIWRAIRYVTNDSRFYLCDDDFVDETSFWEAYESGRDKKYSYQWCLEQNKVVKDWWGDVFIKDPYLASCCDKKKLRSFDQLLYCSEEYWSRR